MAVYTEEQVRSMLRSSGSSHRLRLRPEDLLTPSAKSFLRQCRAEVEYGESRTPQNPGRYRTLFGASLDTKPEHMTHLKENLLVFKDHPRIAFRGEIDSLEAELLLAQQAARSEGYPELLTELLEMLDFVRNFIRLDVLGEPLEHWTLCGYTPEQLRDCSHHPKDYFGQDHFMASVTDGPALLQVNRLRTCVRRTERAAYRAFRTEDGAVTREDIIQGLNRLSSLCWIQMIRLKAGLYKKEGCP